MSAFKTELRPAWRNYWAGLSIVILLLLLALGSQETGNAALFFYAGIAVLVVVVYKRYSWKFTVDERRVARHQGIISRNQQSVRIGDLRSVELSQGFFQRIFGVGDLSFYSAGSADAEVRFFGITQPSEWRDKIDDAMDLQKGSNE